MINLASSIFECETLFLQPTWSCAKNCSGCYVKEKESKFGSEEINTIIWNNIFTHLSLPPSDSKIQTNQVTLALDTLPKDFNSKQYNKMYGLAHLYQCLPRYNLNPNIKYHITVNSANDLASYTGSELFYGLDLVSVSNINNLEDIELIRECAPHTKINWNVLASTFNKKSEEQIKQIINHVNQVYLLLPKDSLGQNGHDFRSYWTATATCLKMGAEEPVTPEEACKIPGVLQKVIADGCMGDALKFHKEGTGCASNVSRFQIWPDGRVTGCAYNSHEQYGKKAESFQDILDNLRDARTRYEFNKCTIPNYGLIKVKKNALHSV